MQILSLLIGSLLLLSISFMFVLGWNMKDRAVAAAIIKAKTDLATCTEIVDRTYPGAWHTENGLLYKGPALITNNEQLVNHLADLTGDTVTFFLGDTRVATTVRGTNGQLAIGTKVSAIVAETVLKYGQRYLGQANVVGQIYQTAYEPLRTDDGTIIGIFYVGISHSYEQEMINDSLVKMAILGAILTLLVSLLALFFVQRVIIKPLHNITLGTRDLATGHLAEKVDVSGPKEIGELAGAFNQMVEHLPQASALDSSLKEEEESQEGANAFNVRYYIGSQRLPKGLNEATLGQIVAFLREGASGPVSCDEVAEGVRLTRVTVRRYLEFLEQCGVLKGELKYGAVGRPVKRFSQTWDRNGKPVQN